MNRVNTNNFRKAAVAAAIAMLIIPLPVWLLDGLLAANILFSLLIVFIVLRTPRIENLSFFPTMILASSVLSLGLNVSSTRLILFLGSKFDGRIVRAFSRFVVGSGGSQGLIIGFAIFIIITIIQALIITKGTSHIARLAVHYMIDTIAKKEKAAKTECNSAQTTEEKTWLSEEQNVIYFYSSMFDAVDFSSNIVKIGLFITVINLVAGIGLGMVLRGETFDKAIQTYTALTIGDGLIAQLPPLLISLAVSFIVIRLIKQAASDESMDDDTKIQFTKNTKIYTVGGITMIIIGLLPGFPWYMLVPLGAVLLYIGSHFLYIGSYLKYKSAKTHAGTISFAEEFAKEIEKANRQRKDKNWLKTVCIDDTTNTEQIAIDMTGPAYNLYEELCEHTKILNKGETEKNEIILKKLTAKWNDIFERKDFFEKIIPKNEVWIEVFSWDETIWNLSDVRNLSDGSAPSCVWNHIASAIKSKRLEKAYTQLQYKTKDNKSLSIGIKKAAFGAVIILSFTGEESTIKMHIYITPHGVPSLPDLREPDIIDAQINVKLPKNKADAQKVTLDDIFAKLGIENFWEKTEIFVKKSHAAYRKAYAQKIKEDRQKQKEDSKEKVKADMEKLNKALSELDTI